jgi:hypothetical protein
LAGTARFYENGVIFKTYLCQPQIQKGLEATREGDASIGKKYETHRAVLRSRIAISKTDLERDCLYLP